MPDYGHEGRGRRGVTMPKGPKGPGPGGAPQSNTEWGVIRHGKTYTYPNEDAARAASSIGPGVVVSRTVTPWKES